MNNKFLYIFLSSNTITGIRIENQNKEILFSNTKLSSAEKILPDLKKFHDYKIKLILEASPSSIKLFNTVGMGFWHRYQLKQRLKKELSQSDWYCMWEEGSNLITLKGILSLDEKIFLDTLKRERFLIVSSTPSLWLIHHNLLKGNNIKKNGIVIVPLFNFFQHVLYLNGLPTNCRISKDDNVSDWLQFISLKYKLSLDVLNISELANSKGNSHDYFITLILDGLPSRTPTVFFTKQYSVEFYYRWVKLFNQVIYGVMIASILVIIYNINALVEIKSLKTSLEKLITTQAKLFSKIPNSAESVEAFKKYTTKRKIIETFNRQTFPTMSFLERISTILPEYGQVSYISINPTTEGNIDRIALEDSFLVKIKITLFKNSKNLQLLTGEIHKHFGPKIRVDLLAPQPKTLTEHKLRHTIEINLKGFIHEIQRLTY